MRVSACALVRVFVVSDCRITFDSLFDYPDFQTGREMNKNLLLVLSSDGVYLATGGAEGSVTVYASFNLGVSSDHVAMDTTCRYGAQKCKLVHCERIPEQEISGSMKTAEKMSTHLTAEIAENNLMESDRAQKQKLPHCSQ